MRKLLLVTLALAWAFILQAGVLFANPVKADTIVPAQLQNGPCAANSELKNTDFCKPQGKSSDRLGSLVTYIVNTVLGIVGTVIVIVIIVAGIQLSASAGDPNAIKNARNRLVAAIVSLVLLISMVAIFNLIGFKTS